MNGQLPTMEARPLVETVGTSDLDQMLREYVKPAFLRLSSENRKKAVAMIEKMAADEGMGA